jgi:hypothetical protein
MAKSLNDILRGVKASKIVPGSTGTDPGVDYAPKAKVEQDFVAKHKTEKHEDRVGNKDDVYKGKTEYVLNKASESRHGYKKDDAEKVYESLQELEEATAKQINDRLDSLVAAKKAEKAGDKKAQYGHLADYHTKYATHVKKSADAAHHKSQAEKYRSASKAFNEAASCNMTNEGTHCPVHEMTSCKESLATPLLGGDDESAEMAKTQLRALANKALALAMHLNDDQVVEPWVQAKIAVAKDNVSAVHDYMVYGDHDKPEKEQTAPYEGGMDMSGSPRNTYPNFGADVNIGRNL